MSTRFTAVILAFSLLLSGLELPVDAQPIPSLRTSPSKLLTTEALAARANTFRFGQFNAAAVVVLVALFLAGPLERKTSTAYQDEDDPPRRDYPVIPRIEATNPAQARWEEFIASKKYIIAQHQEGNYALAYAKYAHLLDIALGVNPDYRNFSDQDRLYAQGALTLLSLDGSETDRQLALDALLQIARTSFEWSNLVANRRENLDDLLGYMEGPPEKAWRAAAILHSAYIPDPFIHRLLIERLLHLLLRVEENLNRVEADHLFWAAQGIQRVFRGNVLAREKGTAVALGILYDHKTPKPLRDLLQSELVAAGHAGPMRQDPRARVTFAEGLKRLDEQNAAEAVRQAEQAKRYQQQVTEETKRIDAEYKRQREEYDRKSNRQLFMMLGIILGPFIGIGIAWGASALYSRIRGKSNAALILLPMPLASPETSLFILSLFVGMGIVAVVQPRSRRLLSAA
jgi:hypothetical protein